MGKYIDHRELTLTSMESSTSTNLFLCPFVAWKTILGEQRQSFYSESARRTVPRVQLLEANEQQMLKALRFVKEKEDLFD